MVCVRKTWSVKLTKWRRHVKRRSKVKDVSSSISVVLFCVLSSPIWLIPCSILPDFNRIKIILGRKRRDIVRIVSQDSGEDTDISDREVDSSITFDFVIKGKINKHECLLYYFEVKDRCLLEETSYIESGWIIHCNLTGVQKTALDDTSALWYDLMGHKPL
jgi:hypothetical protein